MKHVVAQAAGLILSVVGIGLATQNLWASVTAGGLAVVVVSTALEAGRR